jgi:hypothetical protein
MFHAAGRISQISVMLEQEIVAACSFACVERSSAFSWMQKNLDSQTVG